MLDTKQLISVSTKRGNFAVATSDVSNLLWCRRGLDFRNPSSFVALAVTPQDYVVTDVSIAISVEVTLSTMFWHTFTLLYSYTL